MIARERRLAVGIALLLAALGGCAAGQVTQTANQESAVNGASGQAGSIAVRDAVFVFPSGDEHYYPAGSAVALRLTIVNTGDTEDRLAAVQSPAAGSVRLDGATTIPGRSSVRAIATEVATEVATATATETATPEPTTTGAAKPTAGPTSGPATTSAGPPAASGTTTSGPTATLTESELEPGEMTIVLENLTEDIRPGRAVRVVLLFEQAGELVLFVPIASPEEPRGESEH